jgi:hypothetical protein
MKLQYLNYIVEAENQIDDDKFESVLTVYFKLAEDKDNLFGSAKGQLIVINSNSQTGFQMDEQREKESITFVGNLSN